jgi:ferrous iron transport protein B
MAIKYALAGNPNSGKTTLFNELTGSNQYVGNWPGVTVEKKEGRITHGEKNISIVDLPGIYSLSPYSLEEIVTRNYIIEEKPDLVINIVDATNLERNLYLTLQLAELGLPMVIALNMMDVVEKQGDKLDAALLASLLGIKVVPISAAKGTGIHKLIHTAEHELEHIGNSSHVDRHTSLVKQQAIYTDSLKSTIELIEEIIDEPCRDAGVPLRWSAVKLVEGDPITQNRLNLSDSQLHSIETLVKALETDSVDREMVVADQKYKYICRIRNKVLKRTRADGTLSISDKIDSIVTNKYLALPLFGGVMALVFFLTFGALGAKLVEVVDLLINVRFLEFARAGLEGLGAAPWAVGLICDGAIAGIGAVMAFFPQITLLFFFLSLLEDSGYMARAAFIMDRALHSIGLSGRSFVPMLMGFGCSVPAIMATRSLPNERDRRLTVMLVPFMSCSAKMPVYMLFISIFFARQAWLAVSSIYFLGILVGVVYALILQKTVLRGGHAPFVMELPPYRMPTAKTLGLHLWEKVKDFLTKAGTVLLGASILIWFMQYFSFSLEHVTDSKDSILGIVGSAIAPVFTPLGFGDWKSAVAMISGLIARESIVSTMAILYNTGREGLFVLLKSIYTPASAYAMMVFALLFIPCAATIAAIRREMHSAKWTLFAIGFQGLVAWVVTFLVYQVGKLLMSM